MADSNIIQLKNELDDLGFGEVFNEAVLNMNTTNQAFTVFTSNRIADEPLMYALKFERDNNNWQLVSYSLTKTTVIIPKAVIAGIDTKELESRLIKVDEIANRYYAGNEMKGDGEFAGLTNKDLETLFQSGSAGKEIAQVLMFKYWPEANYKKFIPDASKLKENYQVELQVVGVNGKMLSASEANKKVKEAFHVLKRKNMAEEHVISDALFETAQFEISFGREWVAYNNLPYFLDKGDVCFFKHKDEAIEFSTNNISEYDDYKVIHVSSIQDFIKHIPYGRNLNEISNPDLTKEIDYQLIFYKQLKTNVMNNENLQFLTDNIKYMGFGETHKAELEKSMAEGKAEFQLVHKAEINKKPFEATMNFRKSDSTDMYFFNNYHASLEKSNGEKAEQTFYLNKGKGVTGKEAYNLLDGRAVQKDLVTKEGQPYKAWIQLDFENKDSKNNFEVRQFHENYGYDLKAAVEKFAVTELKDTQKEKALMQSLQKGNVQSVTIEKDGSSHKMFMEADPQYKKVTLYDSNMKMVAKESLEQYKSGVDKGSKVVKEGLEESKKKDLKQEPKAGQEKKNDKTLLPKKRESTKKGLGVS